jgi:presequence protease
MKLQNIQCSQTIAGFTVTHIQEIPELRSIAYIFTHNKTGARLLHLYNDDPNNLFSIAFRTPVSNNTGVPHILEHSVLCGSEKFPLKDPFQELLKGSLQTFLNALTYPDKTMYPVSSQVETDFFNLVDVYCDAVFHPLLTKSTFQQEGWHFDVEDITKPPSIKGIVYNEMKGVFSDFSSHVERKTIGQLFPDISYFFESGGIPENITDLTYEQFKQFHSLYYHPSNSFIFLYGNIPSEKTLGFIETNYLSEYDRITLNSEITPQPLWTLPRSVAIDAPAPEADNGTATVAVTWIFGNAVDAETSLLGNVLYHYLLETESAPLKRALIDSGLGEDLDDITGFSSEFVQSIFSVGLRKTKPELAPAIKKLIFDTLQKQVDTGLDAEQLEGSLRQIEFRLREITDAGRFPFNLILAERCYRSWIYGGDPLAYLAFEKNCAALRAHQADDPDYFARKINELLLTNNHHLLTVVTASSRMGTELENQTAEQAKRLTAHFTKSDLEYYHRATADLLVKQKTANAPDVLAKLPRLHKSDLPLLNRHIPVERDSVAAIPAYLHPIFTSGITYVDLGFNGAAIPADLLPYFPLYVELASRCGTKDHAYEAMATRISLATGGIFGSMLCETKTGTADDYVLYYFLHGKALNNRVTDMMGIYNDLLFHPDFTNTRQIRDILFEMRNDLNSSVIDSGHSFATTHAAASLCTSKYLSDLLDGIKQLRFLDRLLKQKNTRDIVSRMQALHTCIVSRNSCVLSVTADDPAGALPLLNPVLKKLDPSAHPPVFVNAARHPGRQTGIAISSSVNFAAQAWRCSSFNAADIGTLQVLARNLSTGYLWNKVRVEGGAYGGFAAVSSGHPIFACSSYRDPNVTSTLEHFTKGLKQLASGTASVDIDQSVIATIGRIDAPRSPHEQGYGETIALLCGRPPEFRQEIRDAVLAATPQSVAKSAETLLAEQATATTVIGSSAAFEKAADEGRTFTQEPLLPETK